MADLPSVSSGHTFPVAVRRGAPTGLAPGRAGCAGLFPRALGWDGDDEGEEALDDDDLDLDDDDEELEEDELLEEEDEELDEEGDVEDGEDFEEDDETL